MKELHKNIFYYGNLTAVIIIILITAAGMLYVGESCKKTRKYSNVVIVDTGGVTHELNAVSCRTWNEGSWGRIDKNIACFDERGDRVFVGTYSSIEYKKEKK